MKVVQCDSCGKIVSREDLENGHRVMVNVREVCRGYGGIDGVDLCMECFNKRLGDIMKRGEDK